MNFYIAAAANVGHCLYSYIGFVSFENSPLTASECLLNQSCGWKWVAVAARTLRLLWEIVFILITHRFSDQRLFVFDGLGAVNYIHG